MAPIPYSDRSFSPFSDGPGAWKLVYYPNLGIARYVPTDPLLARELLVIHVDGGCIGNGTNGAVASYGIWHGENSTYNRCGLLPQGETQTSQAAELFAIGVAIANIIIESIPVKIQDLLIRTDSAYVKTNFTQHIWKWQRNGYKNSKGHEIANRDLIQSTHELIERVRVEHGINVKFEKLSRENNKEADRLASIALLHQSDYKFSPEGPHIANKPWRYRWEYAKLYLAPDNKIVNATARIHHRLELPISRTNIWMDSYISFIIRAHLVRDDEAAGVRRKYFQESFGPDWRAEIERERKKLADDLEDVEKTLAALPADAGEVGCEFYIKGHTRAAEISKCLGVIINGKLGRLREVYYVF